MAAAAAGAAAALAATAPEGDVCAYPLHDNENDVIWISPTAVEVIDLTDSDDEEPPKAKEAIREVIELPDSDEEESVIQQPTKRDEEKTREELKEDISVIEKETAKNHKRNGRDG
jgi:hypothetical protein